MRQTISYQQRRLAVSNQRRATVLTAAGLCFANSGFKGTTMAQVAEKAAVSKGLVFHFFGNKSALFSAVVEDSLQQWRRLSEDRLAEAEKSGNTITELRSLFLASFDFIEQQPVLSLFSRPQEDILRVYKKDFDRKNKSWRNRVQKTVRRGIGKGEVRKDLDVARFSEIFHQLQTALLQQAHLQGSGRRYDASTIELAIDILLRGIAK